MTNKEFLDEVAYKDNMEICGESSKVYKSNFDDSYLTSVGMEDCIKFLAEREITQELTHGVGFSPKDGKWYGWSHRAIYGFGIGSTCRKGDCHYRAANEADEIEAAISFWSDEHHINITAKKIKEGELYVSWEYDDKIINKKLRGCTSVFSWLYDQNFGNGEWEAKTMADAKQMAIDFNNGVS